MNDLSVEVNRLAKQYRIGEWEPPYKTLRESMMSLATAPLRVFRRGAAPKRPKSETFWALRDVSFEVHAGEVIGIIGRNGAGKSTLLKILSRITEPTSGEAVIHGRVSSLLEVGVGFHGELTGRENLYLNGAILGMRKAEIDAKFDEIVAFAEVEKFIDTAVKHYSSGMYLRLAFAVAAHLEPEILIVDEVLAVGDANFQRKCLAKMEDVGQRGRTVLFVSHNMPAVTRLCKRVILLDEGTVLKDGPASQVVSAYLSTGLGTTPSTEYDPTDRPGGPVAELAAARIRSEAGQVTGVADIRRPVRVEMEYEVKQPGYVLMPYFNFHNEEGVLVFRTFDADPEWRRRARPKGRYVSTALIPGNFLAEGTMFVTVGLRTVEPEIRQFHERDVVAFQVVDSVDGDSARGELGGNIGGVVRPLLKWSTDYAGKETAAASGGAGSGS